MASTVKVDLTNLESRVRELRRALLANGENGDAGKILADESRLLLKQCIKFTPPRNRQQGQVAVRRDFGRAVHTWYYGDIKNKRIQELAIIGNYEAVNAILKNAGKNSGGMFPRRAVPFSNDLHTKQRDRRGRIQTDKRIATFQMSAWTARLKQLVARVGRMKSGWVKGYSKLGGNVPAWISRHSTGHPYSRAFVDLSGRTPNILVGNGSAGIGVIQHLVTGAVKARTQAIGKRIKLVLSGYSGDVARGMRIKRGTGHGKMNATAE
jgi:hypothetical protein